jgi:hypothetical protein
MKTKNYLKLETYHDGDKNLFGWKNTDDSISEGLDILLASEGEDTITYMIEQDAFKYVELSTGLKPKQIISSWSFNSDLFDQHIRKYSNSEHKELGIFFISLSNLIINDIPFEYNGNNFYKI